MRCWRIAAGVVALVAALSGCARTVPEAKSHRVRVAAASDLKFAFDEIAAAFHRSHPDVEVTATYGSSGTLYGQLSQRAPFDLYLSADRDYPRRLIEGGLAERDSEFVYAIGHLVVWVRQDSSLDLEKRGVQVLLDPSVRHVAIANPRTAPYGRAAEAALKGLGVYDAVKDKIVIGENVAQAAQFVNSGSAEVGLVGLSLALAPTLRDRGRYWEVPASAYPPLEQAGVILTWADDREAAEAVRAYVLGSDGRVILKRFGFVLPGE